MKISRLTQVPKKFLLLCALSVSAALSSFALPGVSPYISDTSGQYVYYRDSSFERDSYIGFAYFTDSAYGVRYYAPAVKSKKNSRTEKDILIYFSVDPKADHIELTGERIASTISPEDTDLVNYLHDMLYELTARRAKAGDIKTTATSEQDFRQFGGYVSLDFDALIPIFNLKKITASDGKEVLKLVTAGQLTSSNDTSFSDFKGLTTSVKDKKHKFKPSKKAREKTYTFSKTESDQQTITLDSQWTQSVDNLWSQEKNAVLALDIIQADMTDQTLATLKRRLILGTENTYPDLASLSLTEEEGHIKIYNTYCHALSGTVTKDFKILSPRADKKSAAFLTLTVFSGAYGKNQNYFKKILDSYSVK